MSNTRIAQRYAKPLLMLAEEKKAAKRVSEDVTMLRDICESNRDFVLMLRSPIIKHLKKAEILNVMFKDKVHAITMAFFNLVARKNRESILPEFANEFLRLYHDKLGFQEASVTTTFALDKALRTEFEKIVSELTHKKPVIKEVVDPEILGGYVLKMEDKQIDASVSGRLNAIRLGFKKKSI